MTHWLDRIVLIAMAIVTAALAATAMPWLVGGELHGRLLLGHMIASGAFVIGLPVLGLIWLRHMIAPSGVSTLKRVGYWGLILTGLITILTVFICMLPIAGTQTMHQLVWLHGLAGFAAAIAMLALLLGKTEPSASQ